MTIVSETPVTVIPTGTWSIDPVWSALEFEIKKLGLVTLKGRVPGFSGTIEGGETPSITGTVDASTITTFDETRDGHVQSPDFFDTERYPELQFESTAVVTKGAELIVEGDLTIKGVTKPVELRGSFVGAGVDPAPSSGSTGTRRFLEVTSCCRTTSCSGPTSRRSRRSDP